jgi:hypothetical protein
VPVVNGVYSFTTEDQCNGSWSQIDNDDCPPCPNCPQPPPPEPLGRCCSSSGRCSVTKQANCFGVSWTAGGVCTDINGLRIRCDNRGGDPCQCDCEYSGVPQYSNVIVFCTSYTPTGFQAYPTSCIDAQSRDCNNFGCPPINTNNPWCVPQGYPPNP